MLLEVGHLKAGKYSLKQMATEYLTQNPIAYFIAFPVTH